MQFGAFFNCAPYPPLNLLGGPWILRIVETLVCLSSCGELASQGRVDEVFASLTLSQVCGGSIFVGGLRVHSQPATPTINPLFSHTPHGGPAGEDFHLGFDVDFATKPIT